MMFIKPMPLAGAIIGGVLSAGTLAAEVEQADAAWFHPPFRIMADGVPLDTGKAGGGGHAAPYLIDLDRDGKRDLVVGSISGKFHFYKNTGTDAAPMFGKATDLMTAAQKFTQIPNWCRMAAAPQFVDMDGDGTPDLTAGSYGGPTFWLKGLGGLRFDEKRQLVTSDGITVLAHPETFDGPRKRDLLGSYAANIAWTRWDSDEAPDLAGKPDFKTREVLLEEGRGVQWLAANEAPRIGTRSQVHAADYNQDGKLDLLVGYHSQSWIVRKDLTRQQRKRVEEIRAELAAINTKTGNYNDELNSKFNGLYLPEFKAEQARVMQLEKEVVEYLRIEELRFGVGNQEQVHKYSPFHGLVWVYLRDAP
jgi:hypothetical protein